MADDFPDQVKRGTVITEVTIPAHDLQAQTYLLSLNSEKIFGDVPAISSRASAGSTATAVSVASRPSRATQASAGSTPSIASAATIASAPSIASYGSIPAIASIAGVASKAADTPSQGSVASTASIANSFAGKVSVNIREKQQPTDVHLSGSFAAYAELVPPPGQLINGKNKTVIPSPSGHRVHKVSGQYHTVQFSSPAAAGIVVLQSGVEAAVPNNTETSVGAAFTPDPTKVYMLIAVPDGAPSVSLYQQSVDTGGGAGNGNINASIQYLTGGTAQGFVRFDKGMGGTAEDVRWKLLEIG